MNTGSPEAVLFRQVIDKLDSISVGLQCLVEKLDGIGATVSALVGTARVFADKMHEVSRLPPISPNVAEASWGARPAGVDVVQLTISIRQEGDGTWHQIVRTQEGNWVAIEHDAPFSKVLNKLGVTW